MFDTSLTVFAYVLIQNSRVSNVGDAAEANEPDWVLCPRQWCWPSYCLFMQKNEIAVVKVFNNFQRVSSHSYTMFYFREVEYFSCVYVSRCVLMRLRCRVYGTRKIYVGVCVCVFVCVCV